MQPKSNWIAFAQRPYGPMDTVRDASRMLLLRKAFFTHIYIRCRLLEREIIKMTLIFGGKCAARA
jgi:hypothetical protein